MKIYPQNPTDVQHPQQMHIQNPFNTQSFQPTQPQNPMSMHSSDTLSRNTPPELLTRKTTVEIPKKYKILPCKRRNITPTRMQICSKN